GAGDSSNYIYNNIEQSFHISKVFIVGEGKKSEFLKKRIKRFGLLKVMGQILFIIYTKSILRGSADQRIKEINEEYGMNRKNIPEEKVKNIDSVTPFHFHKIMHRLDRI